MKDTTPSTRVIMAPDQYNKKWDYLTDEELADGLCQLKSIIKEMDYLSNQYKGTQWKTDIMPQGPITAEPVTMTIQDEVNAA